MSFLQCPRRLWLEKNRPVLARVSDGQQALFDAGHEVGELARRLYDPGGHGRLIGMERGLAAALRDTGAALGRGQADPLFEATFERDGLLVRTDVLERGNSRLVEVKSSTSVKDEHITDCAIQSWVLEASPAAPRSIALACIDNRFTYRGNGAYHGLLREHDVTAPARAMAARVPGWLDEAQRVLSLDQPQVRIGSRCRQPYECPFTDHCWPASEFPLTDLPGAGSRLDGWLADGYTDLRQLPAERVPPGDGLRVWRATRAGAAEDTGAGRAELAGHGWPRYYLDFETWGPAIPRWPGTRPYQAIPFQWSLHVESRPGALEHAAYLDLSGELPARALGAALLAAAGDRGPVYTYTDYERRCIAMLAGLCPELAAPLDALSKRLVDLHPIARKSFYHPAMHGSWSLKALLPAIAPDLDYGSLEGVRDGNAAQQAYAAAIAPQATTARREEIRAQLLRYCALDTLALARVAAWLRGDR